MIHSFLLNALRFKSKHLKHERITNGEGCLIVPFAVNTKKNKIQVLSFNVSK